MLGEPSHEKQLSLIHVCKIGLNEISTDKLGNRVLVRGERRYSARPHPY
jgi:hypothetical protein